jgi:hypothetical protein
MAFAMVCCLLFLVLSRKSHLFYLAMMGIFLVHVVSRREVERIRIRDLVPFAVMNALMTIEPHFWHWIRDEARPDPDIVRALVAMDAVLVACYAFYVWYGLGALGRWSEAPQGRN